MNNRAAKNLVFKWARNPFPAWLALFLILIDPPLFAETLLLKNAIVHTVSGGTFTNGGVLMEGAKIKSILSENDLAQTTADKTIDLQGRHVYPGMIALDSVLGLSEIDAVRATQDTTEAGDYTPDVQAWIAVNPDSELIPVARANGITQAEAVPNGGVVAGLSGVIALTGWTTEQMTIKHPAALHVYWPEMDLDTTPKEKFKDKSKFKSLEEQARQRQTNLKALEDFFLEARAYARAREGSTNGGKMEINPPWEAMLPVVRGEVPIMLHASDIRQIKAAVKWSQTSHFPIILVGARDAWMAPELLATNKIPVIYEFTFNQPIHDVEPYDINFRTPEILRQAGVTVALANGNDSFHAAMARNLPYIAAQSAAFGLPEADALKAITLYPAQLLGLGQQLGSLEPGKEATLFVSNGNILDVRAQVERMWIAGEEVSLESRHTRLYERYKNRPRN